MRICKIDFKTNNLNKIKVFSEGISVIVLK